MKNLFIGLFCAFVLIGILFFTQMMHTACLVSLMIAIFSGVFFTKHANSLHKISLENQEKLRKRLTADVAHELRTPLQTLGSHLEMMIEGLWEASPERLKSCHEEVLRLGKIVADLENLERSDRNNIELNKTNSDMLELAKTVCGNFESEIAHKNQHIEVIGESSLISVDKDRMCGVITNLMSNAVKYTPRGGKIIVSVRDGSEYTLLSVEDNGNGIPENELPFVFERFYRADKSRNRDTGGAGIGLAIVKSIVMSHRGTVTAANLKESGCIFEVRIPKT
jgi:signal transduction histidine kinase